MGRPRFSSKSKASDQTDETAAPEEEKTEEPVEQDGEKKPASLQNVAREVNKKLKAQVLIPGGEDNLSKVKVWIPTGITLLDKYLYGGIPIGRIWEVFGEPHHGKTAFVVALMIAVQKFGGVPVYLDAEGALDIKWAVKHGLVEDNYLHMQCDTVELGFQTIDETIRRFRSEYGMDVPLLFVWDTIAASQTEMEKKQNQWGDGMAAMPRKVRAGIRRLCFEFPKNNAGMVFVNQNIATMDMFGPKSMTPTGGALKYWATYRISVRKSGVFNPVGPEEGIIPELKMVKCKLGPPNRKLVLPLTFHHGWDNDYANLDFLIRDDASQQAKEGVMVRKGNYYYAQMDGKTIPFYYSGLRGKLDEVVGLRDWLAREAAAEWDRSYGA